MRRQWWRFHYLSAALMETLEHWRESFPEVQSLDHSKLLPNLEAARAELKGCFEEIERMLAGEAPARSPQSVALDEAKDQADRARRIRKGDRGAMSKQELTSKENALRAAQATALNKQASLEDAQLDLEFTQVKAPVDGYVTNLNLRLGSQACLRSLKSQSPLVYLVHFLV